MMPSRSDWCTLDRSSGELFAMGRLARLKYPELWQGCVGAWSHKLDQGAVDYTGKTPQAVRTGDVSDLDGWKLNTGYLLSTGAGSRWSFPTDEACLSMWVRLDVAVPAATNATGFTAIGSTTIPDAYTWTDGKAYLGVFRSSRVDNITLSASVNRLEWHHVAITTALGTNGWKLYQNGSLVHQVDGTMVSVRSNIEFGRSGSFGSTLRGSIDDMRVYNRVPSLNTLRLLASRRHVSYEAELSPRRWYIEDEAEPIPAAHFTLERHRPEFTLAPMDDFSPAETRPEFTLAERN